MKSLFTCLLFTNLRSDSYARKLTHHGEKYRSTLRRISKTYHRLKVVLAINMYTFVNYDAGLSLWRVFSARYSGDHEYEYEVWRWNATEFSRRVHSSRPMTRHWRWVSWSQPLRQANSLAESRLEIDSMTFAYVSSFNIYHCAKNSSGFPNTCWKSDTITRQMHTVLVLFRPLPMLTYKTSACEVCIIWRKPTETLKIHLLIAESRTGKPAMVTLKIQLDCFTVHDTTLWANIFVRSHLGCGTDSVFIHSCRSHKYFKDAKVMQIKRIFENS